MISILKTCVGILAAVSVLCACDTPSKRIRKHSDEFAGLDPSVQKVVKQGNVEVGFTEPAVRIARGEPDRVYTRTSGLGASIVWSYVDEEFWKTRKRVRGEFTVRDRFDGSVRTLVDDVWVDVDNVKQFETYRVEFFGGKVIAVEKVKR